MSTNAFLVFWCKDGIESVIPISKYEKIEEENTFNVLADLPLVDYDLPRIIKNLVLRAQVNGQRSYELYAVDCNNEITREDILDWFARDSANAAETVRRIGHKVYGN